MDTGGHAKRGTPPPDPPYEQELDRANGIEVESEPDRDAMDGIVAEMEANGTIAKAQEMVYAGRNTEQIATDLGLRIRVVNELFARKVLLHQPDEDDPVDTPTTGPGGGPELEETALLGRGHRLI